MDPVARVAMVCGSALATQSKQDTCCLITFHPLSWNNHARDKQPRYHHEVAGLDHQLEQVSKDEDVVVLVHNRQGLTVARPWFCVAERSSFIWLDLFSSFIREWHDAV